MQRRYFLSATGAVTLATAMPARAQTYPSRLIRMVVPFAPGGPTDSFARLYADALGKLLGQTVVVENKAGASGVIGSLDVKNSAADGYTLLFATASTHALYNLIESKPRYDATEDFDYIGVLGGARPWHSPWHQPCPRRSSRSSSPPKPTPASTTTDLRGPAPCCMWPPNASSK